MKIRILVAALVLYGLAFVAAFIQTMIVQFTGAHLFWPDVFSFGVPLAAAAAVSFVAAHRIYRQRRPWILAVAVIALLITATTLLSGLAMIGMALSGPTDSYIGPIGGVAVALSITHAAIAWLGFVVAAEITDTDR